MRNRKHFLFFFLLALLPLKLHALTESQILTEIRVRIKDTSTTRQRWSDTQLLNLVNEAQRDVENQSMINKATTTFTLSPNTSFYAMPSDFLDIYRITFVSSTTGLGYVLPETSIFQLDSLNNGVNWTSVSASPSNYYQDPSSPANIFLYPVPSTSSQCGTLFVNYFQKINNLVNSSDLPFNSIQRYQDYDDTLVYYPAAVVYAVEGESDKSTAYFSLYTSKVAEMTKNAGNHPNFLPGFSGPSNSR